MDILSLFNPSKKEIPMHETNAWRVSGIFPPSLIGVPLMDPAKSIIRYSARRALEEFFFSLFKLRYSDIMSYITYYRIYEDAIAERTAPGVPPKQVGLKDEAQSWSMDRYAIAGSKFDNNLVTPEGQVEFREQARQITDAVFAAVIVDSLDAVMKMDVYHEKWAIHKHYPKMNIEKFLEHEKNMFNCLAMMPDGLIWLIHHINHMQHLAKGTSNALVISSKTELAIMNREENKLYFINGGKTNGYANKYDSPPGAVATAMDKWIYSVKPYQNSNEEIIDPLYHNNIMIGEHFGAYNTYGYNDPELYTSNDMSFMAYDEHEDTDSVVPIVEIIDYCGMFDDYGQLLPPTYSPNKNVTGGGNMVDIQHDFLSKESDVGMRERVPISLYGEVGGFKPQDAKFISDVMVKQVSKYYGGSTEAIRDIMNKGETLLEELSKVPFDSEWFREFRRKNVSRASAVPAPTDRVYPAPSDLRQLKTYNGSSFYDLPLNIIEEEAMNSVINNNRVPSTIDQLKSMSNTFSSGIGSLASLPFGSANLWALEVIGNCKSNEPTMSSKITNARNLVELFNHIVGEMNRSLPHMSIIDRRLTPLAVRQAKQTYSMYVNSLHNATNFYWINLKDENAGVLEDLLFSISLDPSNGQNDSLGSDDDPLTAPRSGLKNTRPELKLLDSIWRYPSDINSVLKKNETIKKFIRENSRYDLVATGDVDEEMVRDSTEAVNGSNGYSKMYRDIVRVVSRAEAALRRGIDNDSGEQNQPILSMGYDEEDEGNEGDDFMNIQSSITSKNRGLPAMIELLAYVRLSLLNFIMEVAAESTRARQTSLPDSLRERMEMVIRMEHYLTMKYMQIRSMTPRNSAVYTAVPTLNVIEVAKNVKESSLYNKVEHELAAIRALVNKIYNSLADFFGRNQEAETNFLSFFGFRKVVNPVNSDTILDIISPLPLQEVFGQRTRNYGLKPLDLTDEYAGQNPSKDLTVEQKDALLNSPLLKTHPGIYLPGWLRHQLSSREGGKMPPNRSILVQHDFPMKVLSFLEKLDVDMSDDSNSDTIMHMLDIVFKYVLVPNGVGPWSFSWAYKNIEQYIRMQPLICRMLIASNNNGSSDQVRNYMADLDTQVAKVSSESRSAHKGIERERGVLRNVLSLDNRDDGDNVYVQTAMTVTRENLMSLIEYYKSSGYLSDARKKPPLVISKSGNPNAPGTLQEMIDLERELLESRNVKDTKSNLRGVRASLSNMLHDFHYANVIFSEQPLNATSKHYRSEDDHRNVELILQQQQQPHRSSQLTGFRGMAAQANARARVTGTRFPQVYQQRNTNGISGSVSLDFMDVDDEDENINGSVYAPPKIAPLDERVSTQLSDINRNNLESAARSIFNNLSKFVSDSLTIMISRCVCLASFNYHNLKACAVNDIPLPLEFIVAMPWMRYGGYSIFACQDGEGTGFVTFGNPIYTYENNAATQEFYQQFSATGGIVIEFPMNLFVAHNVHVTTRNGGASLKFFDPRQMKSDPAYLDINSGMFGYDGSEGAIVIPVPIGHCKNLKKFYDLTGRPHRMHRKRVIGQEEMKELMYPSAFRVCNLYGIRADGGYGSGAASVIRNTVGGDPNTETLRGRSRYFNRVTKKWDREIHSTWSHWGDIGTYPGVQSARAGGPGGFKSKYFVNKEA